MLILSGLICWASCVEAGVIRRFVLAIGANFGGEERALLRYAVSDAENFARVLEEMGGLRSEDRILLKEPSRGEFRRALGRLRDRVAAAGEGRTEVLVFYSGHADDEGLLLGEELFAYQVLRREMDAIPADVRITVLDACASGAITRLKGGERQPAFLLDASSDMQGYAFLTSSSEDEGAQESDLIKASFFTHYLLSGLRGAADVSGDGKITLGEAYQFAFHETLTRTATTRGGAQHPKRDINMSGTGDVVMTDVRQTSAGLLLGEELEGRFFVLNADQQLVAELYKPAGRSVELGLEPGIYEVHLEQKQTLFYSTPELGEGQRMVLGRSHFEIAAREQTALRGGFNEGEMRPSPFGLARRSRLELRIGWWSNGFRTASSSTGGIGATVGTEDLVMALSYAHWIQENLAVSLTVSVLEGNVDARVASTKASGILSTLVGIRYYLPQSRSATPLHPFLSAAVGSFIGSRHETRIASTEVQTMGAFGGQLGGGVDVQMNRHLMLGIKAGYNLMSDFSKPLENRKNYSGLEMNVGISWLFGKGVGTGG